MGTRKNYQRKANGNESPLHVLPVASKLIDYTLDLTDNTKHFPKKVRFTIVNRIQDHVLSIYEKLLAANEIYPIQNEEDKVRRLSLQRDALTACKMLLFFIELQRSVAISTQGPSTTGRRSPWTLSSWPPPGIRQSKRPPKKPKRPKRRSRSRPPRRKVNDIRV